MCDQLYGITLLMLDYYSRKIGSLRRRSKYATVVRSFRFNTSSFFFSLSLYIYVYTYLTLSLRICACECRLLEIVQRQKTFGYSLDCPKQFRLSPPLFLLLLSLLNLNPHLSKPHFFQFFSIIFYRVESASYNYSASSFEGADEEIFGDVGKQLGAMKKKFQSVEEKCVRDVLLAADVIVSTCIGAGVSDKMI